MKKQLFWERIETGISELKLSLDNDSNGEELIAAKVDLFEDILIIINNVGRSTEKSLHKYELWSNRYINKNEESQKSGVSVDSIRASILYFDSRIEYLIGGYLIIDMIVQCQTQSEIEKIRGELISRVASIRKGYFR
ncbi:hypothetical protein [Alkalihalophilus marmarensis]|uniref:Uncharacterized protein n=1 Tax=Alkalihalophilus marmarensis DSM 21297 TaxID=1188261 RepID=U6SL26_9BACI|nr:hypothetical protein [Alkalihalophilus marmarensis]ERN51625.1 hypothetical protein A33I_20035 [Alkalihalophilus marmarensis DSM 21297]